MDAVTRAAVFEILIYFSSVIPTVELGYNGYGYIGLPILLDKLLFPNDENLSKYRHLYRISDENFGPTDPIYSRFTSSIFLKD